MLQLIPIAQNHSQKTVFGFSLVEVIIAIAIVAFIAGIAIPGIMTSANNNKRLGVVKQTMSIIGDAFNNKLESNEIDTNAGFEQFMNVGSEGIKYTRYFPGTTAATQVGFRIDPPPNPMLMCNTGSPCVGTTNGTLRTFTLKNGAYLVFRTDIRFGTAANAAVPIVVDPDGEAKGDFNTVGLWLYADGRIRTNRTIELNTTYLIGGSTPTVNPSGTPDPAWLVT